MARLCQARRVDLDGASAATTVLDLPVRGPWLVQNSPADRVPSHGTEAFGSSHAIDLVPVDARGRSGRWSWRTALATERPEVFHGFGAAVLAPVDGTVVDVHDGEPDHEARRSQLLLVGYLLTQGRRVRAGAAGIAGNHVVLALGDGGPVVLLAHLRRGSIRVAAGDPVRAGDVLAQCGNSGNSTQPHLHLQVSSSTRWEQARGLPMAFRHPVDGRPWLPRNGDIIDA